MGAGGGATRRAAAIRWARRSRASWRLRGLRAVLGERGPHHRAQPLEQSCPLARPEGRRAGHVEAHLDPAAGPVGVLATRARPRWWPASSISDSGIDSERADPQAAGAPRRRGARTRPSWLAVVPATHRAYGTTMPPMDYRHLGRSGMVVSALSYGNWVTHGGQVDENAADACVKAALDLGITTFDTADVYAMGAAEEVLGRALKGVRRDTIEIFTKVYWPTGPNPNNRGLSRKHIFESLHASLGRLQTDHVDLLQAHRYDFETPLEETMRAFDDLVRQGKVHYVGVSEWTAEQIADALRIADDMGLDRIVSNQPQYSLLWRVIEAEVVPLCEKEGIGQIVWSPLAQGVLTGKYLPGSPPRTARGPPPRVRGDHAGSCATRCSSPVPRSPPWPGRPGRPRRPSPWPGSCGTRTSPAPSWGPPAPSRWWRTSRPSTSCWTPTWCGDRRGAGAGHPAGPRVHQQPGEARP